MFQTQKNTSDERSDDFRPFESDPPLKPTGPSVRAELQESLAKPLPDEQRWFFPGKSLWSCPK